MTHLFWLVPIALGMGVFGLGAFLWSLRSGQYEDLDGDAERVLLSDAAGGPLSEVKKAPREADSSSSREWGS